MRTSTYLSLLLERLLERERRFERLGERPLSLREGLLALLGLPLLGLLCRGLREFLFITIGERLLLLERRL